VNRPRSADPAVNRRNDCVFVGIDFARTICKFANKEVIECREFAGYIEFDFIEVNIERFCESRNQEILEPRCPDASYTIDNGGQPVSGHQVLQ
jgi:hypothetical protein